MASHDNHHSGSSIEEGVPMKAKKSVRSSKKTPSQTIAQSSTQQTEPMVDTVTDTPPPISENASNRNRNRFILLVVLAIMLLGAAGIGVGVYMVLFTKDSKGNSASSEASAPTPMTTARPFPPTGFIGTPMPSPSPVNNSVPTLSPSLRPSVSPTRAPISSNWTQVGQTIVGLSAGDLFGEDIVLSGDATILAVAARWNDGDIVDSDRGSVQVYQWSDDETKMWSRLGQTLYGEFENDIFGESIALSKDGKTLAVGAIWNDGVNGENTGHVRVFRLVNEMWTQIGSDIEGEVEYDQFGQSVALSADGSLLAAGAPTFDGNGMVSTGQARVYRLVNNNEWTQIGSSIIGEYDRGLFGESIALSADGRFLAVGGPLKDGNGGNAGHVRVFRVLENDSWWPVGSVLNGQNADDYFGTSIALSADGKVLAVGAPFNDGDNVFDSRRGQVRVFQLVNDYWSQLGSVLNGENESDEFGRSVTLSSDGSILAVGANGAGGGSGHVRLFQMTAFDWAPIGSGINGTGVDDNFGISVSLSNDGRTLAGGAHQRSFAPGYVMVYRPEEN